MIDAIIHFIKHFIGLCGESHPSLLVTGTAFFTGIWVSWKRVIEYIKSYDIKPNINYRDLLPKWSSIFIWIVILIIYIIILNLQIHTD
jgi:hypothetical protein|tara:strand:+ start:736 stop:999 length:264 start_codon:yes stop_codon:yes gene_type:complete